jgi:hypothetical protein
MLTDSPMTPQEEVATAAWDTYAAAAQMAQAAWCDNRYTSADRRRMHERVLDAQERFAEAYRVLREPVEAVADTAITLLVEPTPEPLRMESGRLCAEGFALLAVIGWAVILLVPAVFEHAWMLLAALAAAAALAGWAGHYLGRLGRHLGRRL